MAGNTVVGVMYQVFEMYRGNVGGLICVKIISYFKEF
jgi:hypothetical protein